MAQVDSETSTTMPEAEKPQDSFYLPTDVTPEELFQAIWRLRNEARNEIHRLIQFLDETDTHMELEPSLGFPEPQPTGHNEMPGFDWPYRSDELSHGSTAQHLGAADDREEEACLTEPSLGSLEDHPSIFDRARLGRVAAHSQENWAGGNSDDREGDPCCDDREGDEEHEGGDEHDGTEPDEDGEPSLGWTNDGFVGNSSDCDDTELQDYLPVQPQQRNEIEGPKVSAYSGYRKFLLGLTDEQKREFRKRGFPFSKK